MTSHVALRVETDPAAWVTAARKSLEAVATTALQLPTILLGAVPAPTAAAIGAYIPVMSPGEPLQIGIVADEASCRHIARALLQMSPEDELSPGDAADAFGEIANMVAGLTKAAMSAWIGLVGLGLPMVIHGWIAPSESIELDCFGAELGTATLTIVIARSRRRR